MRHLLLAVLAAACLPAAAHHTPERAAGAAAPLCTPIEAAMPYATRADLVARFGAAEIADLAPLDTPAEAPTASARADAVLADTDAEIDAVLAERFDTPLPAADYPLLKAAACDVARARLYDDAAPERVLGRASSARKRVRQLATGERHLLTAAGERVAPRPQARATSAPPRYRGVFAAGEVAGRWNRC